MTAVPNRTAAPVVVVDEGWVPTHRGRVAVGIKSVGSTNELLAHTFDTADTLGSALHVVHAQPSSQGVRYEREARALRAEVDDWSSAYPAVSVDLSVVTDDAVDTLHRAGEDADVVVVARHHRDLQHLVRLGPVPRAVMATCAAPVEIVPLTGRAPSAPLVLERDGRFLKT